MKIKEPDKDKENDGMNEKAPRIKRKHEENVNQNKKENSKKTLKKRFMNKKRKRVKIMEEREIRLPPITT